MSKKLKPLTIFLSDDELVNFKSHFDEFLNMNCDDKIKKQQEELDKTRLSELDKEYRIDKAIEYINEMTLTSNGYASYGDDLRPEHIVNILKGSE